MLETRAGRFNQPRSLSMISSVPRTDPSAAVPLFARGLHLASGGDPENGPRNVPRFDRSKSAREDLPYRVELWDDSKQRVEQVLAVTAHSSIGYAAYYAATREYPDRYITLRHKNSIVTRWNGPD
jgi:hypothetical protein